MGTERVVYFPMSTYLILPASCFPHLGTLARDENKVTWTEDGRWTGKTDDGESALITWCLVLWGLWCHGELQSSEEVSFSYVFTGRIRTNV